jgi:D-glycerate 3-kinase
MSTPTTSETQSGMIDDKSPICIPFILSLLKEHRTQCPAQPFIIGLNGVQGVGKTTLVKALAETLQQKEGLQTLVCSIDDFYLTHEDQVELAASHPDNKLLQHRGEPGTHDTVLANAFFAAIVQGQRVKVPRYDKSAFAGQGDRVSDSLWDEVNTPEQPPVQVIIFEGWCVGFRPLDAAEVEARWKAPSRTLATHQLAHLLFVNDSLKAYDPITDLLSAFIHVDAQDTTNVYAWRQEQESALRREKGTGMTDDRVVAFVDGYYPAYELFVDAVRRGIFSDRFPGRQLRLIVGKDRRVKQSIII